MEIITQKQTMIIVPRKEGGRGLMHVEGAYIAENL
jgi:hypothetical protein